MSATNARQHPDSTAPEQMLFTSLFCGETKGGDVIQSTNHQECPQRLDSNLQPSSSLTCGLPPPISARFAQWNAGRVTQWHKGIKGSE